MMANTQTTPSVRSATGTKFFTVYCASEIFGLSVEHAQTIFRVSAVTPVPLCRPEIIGLVNLRGKIVTAVSLRQRLQVPGIYTASNNLAIGIEHGGENFALIVDEVGDVIELEDGMQIAKPAHLDPQRAKLTAGLYRFGQQIVPILSIEAIFDFDR